MNNTQNTSDVILIGAGIMSATLGAFFKELAPDWKISVFEKLPSAGMESTDEWNNAGTGHSALCELNYTVEKADGTMDISKAIRINEQFQLSRQFWSYLVEQKLIDRPEDFIMPLPHISMVQGEDNVRFLKKRYEALSQIPQFQGMEYTEDKEILRQWMPLIMENRREDEVMAATKIDTGTDVNFGALTRTLFKNMAEQGVNIHYQHLVQDLKQNADKTWTVKVKNLADGTTIEHTAKFVFIGGGGSSLLLLQKSGIVEGKGIGGFPISGLFMVCENEEVVEKHFAKVYGKARVGAPPMSVPHLDTRYIDGKRTLLFGPFAGFSPRFLKTGSLFDLIKSVKPHNILTLLASAFKQVPLIKYLVQQLLLSDKDRLKELQEFVPNAQLKDWRVVVSGQRVQVIKDTKEGGKGTLQFGTEVICSADGSISALLGASPGASTAVHVMLEILGRCFPEKMEEWEPKIKEMIPSYGINLTENPDIFRQVQEDTAKTLGLVK